MKASSWLAALGLLASLAACNNGQGPSGGAGSGAPQGGYASTIVRMDGRGGNIELLAGPARYSVTKVDIAVPRSLVVSEANLFYPKADIVWRADPSGDRYVQVQSLLQDGFAEGVKTMKTGPSTSLEITLERFHSLTEKARFSVGGVHNVVFSLIVRDLATGQIVEGPRRIEVAIRASGNDKAIDEDAAGNTQRVVIVAGIAEAIRRELALVPVGIAQKGKGLFAGLTLNGGTR